MFPPNTWVFDLEIIKCIPQKGVANTPGLLYCRHWGDHANMGISVICAARPDGSEMVTFVCDPYVKLLQYGTIMDFYRLIAEADFVVGYGSHTFDAKVLSARGVHIRPSHHLDLLREVKKAVNNVAPKGWKLSDASQRIGFATKDFDGAQAPIAWQQGRYQEVIEYCQLDVYRTCALAVYYANNGASLLGPEGQTVYLRKLPEIMASP